MNDAFPPTHPPEFSWLDGGGELGALIRAYDWANNPLGPLDRWPQSLRTVTNMLLLSPIPIVLLWGEKGIMIYNDAYSVFAGGRHPFLLGSEVRKGWPEVADFNDNVMKVGLGGGTLSYRDQRLTLYRNGEPEPVWMNLDYSPVIDESGGPGGVIAFVVETSDRIRAAQRLRESERRFRALVNASSEVVYRMDPTWSHMYQLDGKGFLSNSDTSFTDWLGRYVPPEEQPRVSEAIGASVRNGTTLALEHRVYRQDGTVGWIQSHAVPVLDDEGHVLEWFGAGSDITARKSAEQALREDEARLRFLDALNEETARSTSADQVLASTTRMLGIYLGVTVCAYADVDADQNGFTIRGDWAAPGARSIVGHYHLSDFGQRAVAELSAGKPLVLKDVVAELPDTEARTFTDIGLAATICMPLVKEGRLTALMAIHDDEPRAWSPRELSLLTEVTERSWAHIERVRAEAAARESERRFREELEAKVAERTAALERSEANIRTIFDTSHLYQGLLSADGRLLHINQTALEGMGARLEDVLGMPFWQTPLFTATPGMSAAIQSVVRRVAQGATENMSVVLELPEGTRAFDFSLRPVINEHGEVAAMVPEAVDKTVRLKTEQALAQAQKMEALGSLTGGIAHDFNNLLMAVQGSLELLRERMPQEPVLMRLLDNARAGAERGSSLTRRMLAFARRQDLKAEHIQLRELVEGMAELMQRSLGSSITIETYFAASLPAVVADANQLESALLNLAVNARDAMEGVGTIVISTSERWMHDMDGPVAPGHYVCLALTDSGMGMDDRTLKRATEPFFTTKGVGKGTGLGLSMVHGLAEQSGGALLLRSQPGVGTTAEIWLPAAEARDDAAEPQAAQDGTARCEPTTGSARILTVDDDDLVRATTAEMLEDLGYQVVQARSGSEALRVLNERTFDLMITDHAMPHMTGAQLIGRVRERWPSLPIVMATGYAELPAGVRLDVRRLAKPYSQASLADAVTSVLASHQPSN